MEINPKYKIEDNVFFLENNEIRKEPVISIHVDIWGRENNTSFEYLVGNQKIGFLKRVRENKVYKTKQELLESL